MSELMTSEHISARPNGVSPESHLSNVRRVATAAKMNFVTMAIGPADAEELLKNNIFVNRPVKRQQVREFAEMIRNGQWVLTHQGIALDSQFRLLDGQHRLHAIIEAGKTVDMVVAFNCDPASFYGVDRGRARADHFAIREERASIKAAGLAYQIIHNDFVLRPSLQDKEAVLKWLNGPIDIAVKAAGDARHQRMTGPYRLAVAAHILLGNAEYSVPQFVAFSNNNYRNMGKMTESFANQVMAKNLGSTDKEKLLRAFIAFDPERRNGVKVQVQKGNPADLNRIKDALVKAEAEYNAQ